MSTGTIQNKAPQIFMDIEATSINVSFVNDAGEALVQGQEVILKTDGTIDKRSTGSQTPLGVVVTGAKDGDRAVVNVLATYTGTLEAAATLVPGDFAYQTGAKNANGIPKVGKCVADDKSILLVIKGGVSGALVKVIYLRAALTV